MRYFLFSIAFLLSFAFVKAQKTQAYFQYVKQLDKVYTSTSSWDTLTFHLTKSFKACYVFIKGSDIDQDSDGDYTDFFLKLNNKVILNTEPLANLSGFGKNGKLGTAALLFSNQVPGIDTIILGNTEQQGQTDYAVITDVSVYCTDADLKFENQIENLFKSKGYFIDDYQAYNLKNDQQLIHNLTFLPGVQYQILAMSSDSGVLVSCLLKNNSQVIAKQTTAQTSFKAINYFTKSKQHLQLQITLHAPDQNSHVVSVWVFAKKQK